MKDYKIAGAAAGVLFDLDGVLLDTEGTYTAIWEAIEKHFPTGVADFAHVIKGCNLHDILTNYFPDASVQRRVVEMLDESQATMPYPIFDGAMTLIEALRAAQIPMAVVTSSDDAKMAAVTRQHPHFLDSFNAVITGDMVTSAKPDPQCFLLGAKAIGRNIGDCWVVEDSLNGLRAGRAAGAHVAGIATTLPRAAVESLSDVTVNTIAELTIVDLIL